MLGRFRQGEWLPLLVLCTDADGLPTNPDKAPLYIISHSTGGTITSGRLCLADVGVTGLFATQVFLEDFFVQGEHLVQVFWSVGSHHGMKIERFTVIPGGNGSGQVVSMVYYERQPNRFLVNQRDSGRIYKGRNPLT